ncbi:MAG: hypothetical protein Q8L69_09630 [Gallionellaceae bacterium]|nr:hypothetical protein [Gallionellaceae bacterium]
MTDIEKYALPAFVGLVAFYQIAGLLTLIWKRQVPDHWDVVYWTFGTTIFTVGYVLAMYGAIAIAIDAWHWVGGVLAELAPLTNQTQFMVVTGLMSITAGCLLFWFRLKQRFLYGLTETCVGVIVGMHRVTLEQWTGVPKNTGFYIALLTAGIYLVVRGLDNMHQAYLDGDSALQRIIGRVFKPLSSKATRTRIARVRTIRMRKVRKIK